MPVAKYQTEGAAKKSFPWLDDVISELPSYFHCDCLAIPKYQELTFHGTFPQLERRPHSLVLGSLPFLISLETLLCFLNPIKDCLLNEKVTQKGLLFLFLNIKMKAFSW